MTRIFILLKSSILWSDSPKCWLTGRNGFFVRTLLCPFRRLRKNVNNICTLAINSTKYFVLYSGDLTGIRWRALHMSTTFAAFVSIRVTLAYSCARLRNFCPYQQVSQTDCLVVWRQPWEAQERLWTVLNFFRRMSNAHEWCWSCFSDRDGMWGHKGFFCISVFLCTEVSWSWRCYELR